MRHFNRTRSKARISIYHRKESFDKKNSSLILNEHDNDDLIIDLRKRYIDMLKKVGAKYLYNNLMTRIRFKTKNKVIQR
jgi:hypothetical protein